MSTSSAPPAPSVGTPRGPRPGPSGLRRYLAPALVLVVAFTLIGIALLRDDPGSAAGPAGAAATPVEQAPDQAADAERPSAAHLERRDPQDPLAAGPVDAPVVMIVFSDYQCPYCALWIDETEPAMMELVDAGHLRIEWRDVNVFGVDSERAARAAYAAGLQDRFWEFHRALTAGGEKRTPDQLTEGALVDLAGELGLDVDRFSTDLGSAEVADGVRRNQDEGMSIGAYSTPTFVIGGQQVLGAQPTQVFVDAVQAALARAGR